MRIKTTNINGFTLVELSIVLVIVGLLIGGILVGQSLIESSKLNGFVGQIQQYDIAAQNFKGKYKKLPGDARITGVAGGYPKNGFIEDDDNVNNDIKADIALYWQELKLGTGLKSKCPAYSSVFTSGVILKGTGCNLPQAEIGTNAAIEVISNSISVWNPSTPAITRYKTFYFMMDCSLMTTERHNCSSAFTALEAAAYDSKIDDGKPNSGIVLAVQNRIYSQSTSVIPAPYTSWLGTSYDTTISTPNYIIVQYLGVN